MDSNIGTISLTVNPVNDLPIVNGTTYTIAGNNYASSGNIFTGILTGVDAEDLILTYTATTLPVN